MPGASTIVVFDERDETAARSALSDETLTTVPVGGGSAGAGRAGAASDEPASDATARKTATKAWVRDWLVKAALGAIAVPAKSALRSACPGIRRLEPLHFS